MGEPASQDNGRKNLECWWKTSSTWWIFLLASTFKTFPYCQTVPYREFFCDAFHTKGQIFANLETPHGQILCKIHHCDVVIFDTRIYAWNSLKLTVGSQVPSSKETSSFSESQDSCEGPCWNECSLRSLCTKIYSWLHSFTVNANGETKPFEKRGIFSTSDSFLYCRVLYIDRKTHLRSCFFLPLHLFFPSPLHSRLLSTAKDSK